MTMYQAYFGLDSAPFSIVPDHRVVYMSESHREAVAHLLYSLKQSGGFVQLTGEVGTGKTTVCRYLLQHLPDNVDVALLLNPRINEQEMLESICDELGITYPPQATLKQLLRALNKYLLSFHGIGRYTTLIIDEAQNLSREVLEQVRLLTNLETSSEKLLQIILIGQPELVNLLARHDLRQLSQRIIGRFKLQPLNLKETTEYISYRLQQAGSEDELFTRSAVRRIYKFSQGVPRVINVLCDSALMEAYSSNKPQVDRAIVNQVAEQVLPQVSASTFPSGILRYSIIGILIAVAVTGMLLLNNRLFNGLLADAKNTQIRAIESTDTIADSTDSFSISADQATQQLPQMSEPNISQPKDTNTSPKFDLTYRLGVPLRTN